MAEKNGIQDLGFLNWTAAFGAAKNGLRVRGLTWNDRCFLEWHALDDNHGLLTLVTGDNQRRPFTDDEALECHLEYDSYMPVPISRFTDEGIAEINSRHQLMWTGK